MIIEESAIRAIENIQDRNQKVYAAAKYYASQGIPVIPMPLGEKKVGDKTIYESRCSCRESKIDMWFDPVKGRYRGGNIALGCGDYFGKGGIFVIDIDMKAPRGHKGGPFGKAVWDSLIETQGPVRGPIQKTPSGGLHQVTLWQEDLVPSQNRLGSAIDTRGGHAGKISSHIMAFPSVVDGKDYTWISFGEIVEAPEWIVQGMGQSWKKGAAVAVVGGRGSENVDAEALEQQVPLDKAEKTLNSINPDDLSYDEWVRLGQAIHSQHPGSDGLKVWDDWSQKGERYEEGECAKRWNKFDVNGPIRMGTLFYIAKNSTEQPDLEEPEINENDENAFLTDMIDEYNSKYAVVLQGESAKIIKKEGVLDSIQFKFKTYSVDAFNTFYGNDKIEIPDGKNGMKLVKKFTLWMSSPRRRSFDGMMMDPSRERVIDIAGYQYLNTWAGFAVRPEPGDWSLMKHHILHTLCDGAELLYNWLMDWMADMLQDPANPKGCAVVLGGIEGAGKGTVANALAHILGIHASIVTNGKHLTSQYNDMIADSVFMFADEVVYAGNHEAANLLKAMVTEKETTREKKFGDKEKVRSFIHIMMATNNKWKIAAGPESRRWFVLQVKPNAANDVVYFGKIKQQMENGGYEAMLDELLNREITSNLRYAPETEELRMQRTMLQVQSHSESLPAWLSHMLDTGTIGVTDLNADMQSEGGDWPKLIDKASLWDCYAEWTRKYKPRAPVLSTSVFFPELKAIGFEDGPRTKKGNARVRTIVVPDFEELVKAAAKTYAIHIDTEGHK